MADKQIQCASCGRSFTFTAGEQNHYEERGISEPKRCKECRDTRQSDSGGRKGRGAQMKEAARQMDALFKPAKEASKKDKQGSDQQPDAKKQKE